MIQWRTRQLPAETNYLKIKSFLSSDENSSILNYYQLGKCTIRKSCLTILLLSIMDTQLFDILRNQEQLGYSVHCYNRNTWGILGIEIDITSQEKKHPVDVVNDRIEKFLREYFKKYLDEMTEDALKIIINSQIKLKTAKEIDLSSEFRRNWNEIKNEHYMFDRKEQEVEMFKTLTKSELIEFYQSEILSSTVRKLSIQIIGQSDRMTETSNELIDEDDNSLKLQLVIEKSGEHNEIIIQDITEFQNKLILNPIH